LFCTTICIISLMQYVNMVVQSPSPPPPAGRGKGRCNIGKKLRENLPQVIRKVRVNRIFIHGISSITNCSNKNRCTKLITTLVNLRSKIGKVYTTNIRSPALGIKYVTILLSTHFEFVAQNKVTETVANVMIRNTRILPKITKQSLCTLPLYCTATLHCTAAMYRALCTPAKIHDVQTNQPIGMGQRVYTNKVNNIGRGERGGVYLALCQSLTEQVTFHIYYFSKLHVAWSLSVGHEIIVHYIAFATIVVLVVLIIILRWLPSNEYWHNPPPISTFPSTFTTSCCNSNGPVMDRKKHWTFSYSTCLGIYYTVRDTIVVLAAVKIIQFRSLTQVTKFTRLNIVNVPVPITVKSIERKMSSVSPPRDEETAGKYICRPVTISVNFNTLSRNPVNLMSCIPLCFCTAAVAVSLSYLTIFPRYPCLNPTLPARNGSIYYGE
jgi:hypothetical protein